MKYLFILLAIAMVGAGIGFLIVDQVDKAALSFAIAAIQMHAVRENQEKK